MRRARVLTIALALSIVTLIGGIDLPASGYASFRYAPFGWVAGLLGAIYVYALSERGVLVLGGGRARWLLTAYWVAATATVFRILLPPPGLAQVALAVAVALAAGVVAHRPNRRAAASVSVVIAVSLAALQIGFAGYTPRRPAAWVLCVGATLMYAAALRAQWRDRVDDATSGADLLQPDSGIATHRIGDQP